MKKNVKIKKYKISFDITVDNDKIVILDSLINNIKIALNGLWFTEYTENLTISEVKPEKDMEWGTTKGA